MRFLRLKLTASTSLKVAADGAGYNHTSPATSAGRRNKQGVVKWCFAQQLLKEIYWIIMKVTESLSKENTLQLKSKQGTGPSPRHTCHVAHLENKHF